MLKVTQCAVLICNELRSESVHGTFFHLFEGHFHVRRVGSKHLHPDFSSPYIHLYHLRRRKQPLAKAFVPPAHAVHQGAPGA
jgi:hypothetical protein